MPVAWGAIGFRSVGTGPPLVLLIGGGGPADSIDDWPPLLVSELARHRQVLAMDYEGIGLTSTRPGPLSITRMADDTADFIGALGLGQADVLGWSMGGFVAQSLAVRHPGLVRRLVLCASALGDGTATRATVSGAQAYPGQWLFPPGPRNRARAQAYERAVHSYVDFSEGPPEVASAEGATNYLWLTGSVAEGHLARHIRVPVLVGDGSHDVLTPLPDAEQLARALPRGRLFLYPDAGHGFLVQHPVDWAARVERFLS